MSREESASTLYGSYKGVGRNKKNVYYRGTCFIFKYIIFGDPSRNCLLEKVDLSGFEYFFHTC